MLERTTRSAWEATVDAIQDPIAIIDGAGCILHVNRALGERLGRDQADLVGKLDVDVLFGGDGGDADLRPRAGLATYETSELSLPGTYLVSQYPIELESGAGLVIHMSDVSALKAAQLAAIESEARLRQSHKLEAVGRLAGGVAHDFNNLLTTILFNSELLLGQTVPAAPVHDGLSQIHQAAVRGAALTRRILSFSRAQVVRPELIDLNAVLADMSKLLARLIGEDVHLETIPEPDLAVLRIDRTQVEQIVMNLAVNARDAMPAGGKLTFATRNVAGARPIVALVVSDTGLGMDEETLERAFEPFYTTKDEGKGTGLGLSTVADIVEKNRGEIDIESGADAGTRVEVRFPAVCDADGVPTRPLARRNGDHRGREKILLVEDDDAVRRAIRRLLESFGYRVVEARSAEAALRIARAGAIDLVLTDLILSGMSGAGLTARLRERHPRMKAVIMSGYAPGRERDGTSLSSGDGLIQKPFRPAELASKLRSILARKDEP